jgi:hypothetical protein
LGNHAGADAPIWPARVTSPSVEKEVTALGGK